MNLTARVKGILLRPKDEWPAIAEEKTTIAELYKGYVAILAAIGPVASIIGMSIVGMSLPYTGTFRMSLTTTVPHAIVQYVLTLIGVYVLAFIIDSLAPAFSGEKKPRPGIQAGGLLLYRRLDSQYFYHHSRPGHFGHSRALRSLSSLPGASRAHEISAGKVSGIYRRSSGRSYCHFCGNRSDLACLHFLSDPGHADAGNEIGEGVKIDTSSSPQGQGCRVPPSR